MKCPISTTSEQLSTAILVTVGTGGRPAARPMHMACINEEAGSISFLTGKGGNLVQEIQKEAVILLEFHNENSAYLSLPGRAKFTLRRSEPKRTLERTVQGMVS
jgi:general stress protein 26